MLVNVLLIRVQRAARAHRRSTSSRKVYAAGAAAVEVAAQNSRVVEIRK